MIYFEGGCVFEGIIVDGSHNPKVVISNPIPRNQIYQEIQNPLIFYLLKKVTKVFQIEKLDMLLYNTYVIFKKIVNAIRGEFIE